MTILRMRRAGVPARRNALLFLLCFLPLIVSGNESPQSLHDSILAAVDASNHSEAALLLQKMKTQYPERYSAFPYALLHAKSLFLSSDLASAFSAYSELTSDSRPAKFALIALARIAVTLGKSDEAVAHYQSYLRNSKYPDYKEIALEALDYCIARKKTDKLPATAQIIQRNSATRRLGELYIAKSYRLKNENQQARSRLLNLIRYHRKDDITSQALSDLDSIDGKQLSEQDRAYRGKLAYEVWNFELSRKYLEPTAAQKMEHAYYYARSLYFLGDLAGAKKAFQKALDLWPEHSWAGMCLYQYAGVALREGDHKKAEEIYTKLKNNPRYRENAAFKLIEVLRAQSRLEEAIREIAPYCSSRNSSQRSWAVFLRGRIYFQAGLYREAYVDFDQLLKGKSTLNQKETLFWKGLALEKMNQSAEALAVFRSVASGSYDFYSLLALEKTGSGKNAGGQGSKNRFNLCRLPDHDDEEPVLSRYAKGEVLSAFLYLHLYEESAQQLSSISAETWKILKVDPKNRQEKYLAIAYLAGLGRNYPTATYYSEVFLKTLPKSMSLFSLSEDVLRILFPIPYKDQIEKFAGERSLDPLLVLSIMKQESKFKIFATSRSFARGLMQLIPPTATKLASAVGIPNFSLDQLYKPELNINLGTKYLEDMVKKFGNRDEVIMAGYNAGESNARRWLSCTSTDEAMEFFSNIDLAETKNYVMIVKTNYEWYKRIIGLRTED